ncbi:F-box protein [Carex littledalei]|uniref:F-box protein n=1 Tax=Carex littledalei TaxID=544730 RepID=A0A833VAU2_9POAL|nr:F-box protein [Carex littledalei]
MSSERDWTALPSELIHLVSQKLPDLRYFIRCRAVCKRWLSSVLLSDPPQQQLPWLIEYSRQFPQASPLKEELRFYSFVSGETGSIPIQESHCGKVYHRPRHSYLLVVHGEVISLLNPLTNEEIYLPQLPSRFDTIRPVSWGADLSHSWQWHISLVCDVGRCRYLTYYLDKMRWQCFDTVLHKTCYWNGMLFTTKDCDMWTGAMSTVVFDAASRKELYTIPPPVVETFGFITSYIVESCGELLRVSWEYNYNRIIKTYIFLIYKLNFEGGKGQPHWVKVSNIRDQIIFLDHLNGFSVRATAGLKGNCIYFIEEHCRSDRCYNDSKLWRYDIATGTCEPVPCPFERCTWFVPSLY